MIGKFLFFLATATTTFLGLSAGAVTTSQNVDIIVTHGAALTTFTFVNDTGNTLPAGSPVSFGQSFRYGDIMSGSYPLIRNAATHVALPGQQWDEISTWRENGGNGSWRHAVWAAWLPADVAAGATFQVEFVVVAGTYSETSHQSLSALCSGPAAHHLKIHYTDLRNQDNSVRDSGDATFDVCNNINNTGRDAPRHVRAGNVYDEYIVSGVPVYTSGHQDPLLYDQAIIDIFTKASDGVSAGDVRWVIHNHNSWENVAAGSTGNAGNPGPAGFANDPQMVSYRVEIDDGASDVLDWSNLDATIASSSNPIVAAAGVGCNAAGETSCLDVPASTGANKWYQGQATRVSCTATCVGGLNNGQLYWVWPSGSAGSVGVNTQYVSPMLTPYVGEPFPLTSSQGSGTTTFSTRVTSWHFETWQTLDWTGLSNWSPFGTTTRVTRKVYPTFTAAEARYWQETGLIVPINLSQPTGNLGPDWSNGLGNNYEPMGRMNVIGGSGVGTRPDLGISGEYAAKAFITQAQGDWDLARLFTYGTSVHGFSTLLDKSTGRLSAMNGGPPLGPGGNGNGSTYAGLGALRNQINWYNWNLPGWLTGIVQPVDFSPNPSFHYAGGTLNGGTGIDHMPAFDGFTYEIFGDRHFLDMLQWNAMRDFAQQRPGPGPDLGQGYYRDNNATFTDGNVYHYWGLMTICFQGRGSAWLIRDVTYAATFGADPNTTYPDGVTKNSERAVFEDYLTETSNYWPMFLAFRDGPGSTGYSGSIYPPDEPDTTGASVLMASFVATYVSGASYIMETFQHVPVASTWNTKFQRYYEGILGGQIANAPVSFYGIDYSIQPQISNGSASQPGFGGNVGQYMNGVDAADFGSYSTPMYILSGGQMESQGYTVTAGDTFKMVYNGWYNAQDQSPTVDQLPGTRWFTIMGPVANSGGSPTWYVQCNSADHAAYPTQCPTAGGPFVGFTHNGVAVPNLEQHWPKFRFQYDPGPNQGYVDPNYSQYGGQTINGLAVLGYNVSHATADFLSRCGPGAHGANCYNQALPSNWWDPTIVVPGLPAPHNGL